MGKNIDIEKLPQEVINQIAAGEVIERPASVIKELVDNSIDSGATQIKIQIKNGGKKLIEISDNGSGMSRNQLQSAFDAHTTSKLRDLNDLDALTTLGFRGEALSTIVAVSEVEASSKRESENVGTKISFDGIKAEQISDFPRERGTTITVKNLFGNIPARLKYLRTDETEYRYILQILIPFIIFHKNIHFIFKKDDKEIYNLPKTQKEESGLIDLSRVKNTLRSNFTDELISIHFDGNGLKVEGYISHPQFHKKRVSETYVFLNGRSIKDPGLKRSVYEGYTTFIPRGEKAPFVIALTLSNNLVDINVHPRKEEVRFQNPYRVYSAVEQAVSDALKREFSNSTIISNTDDSEDIAFSRLRENTTSRHTQKTNRDDSNFQYTTKPTGSSVKQSIEFSQILLDQGEEVDSSNGKSEEDIGLVRSVHQIFNKYLLIEFEEQIWLIDQHAAAERITYEKLLSNIDNENPEVQNLLLPLEIEMDEGSLSFYKENIEFFRSIGFGYQVESKRLRVEYVPVQFENSNFEKIFKEIDELEIRDKAQQHDLEKQKNDIVATIACHNSIRTNQRLHSKEIISIYEQLLKCDNPYSCPHGRPIVWKLSIDQIDTNFDRTY